MIFVPLLHYFRSGNNYSGNEGGMRYRLLLGKRTVTDADGKEKKESYLTVEVWPDPWTIEWTDPALVSRKEVPLTEEGRAEAAAFLHEQYTAKPERWQDLPSILDCEPWRPPAEPEPAEEPAPDLPWSEPPAPQT